MNRNKIKYVITVFLTDGKQKKFERFYKKNKDFKLDLFFKKLSDKYKNDADIITAMRG